MKRKYHKVRNIGVKYCSLDTYKDSQFKSTHGRGRFVENEYLTNMIHDAILYDLPYAINENKNMPIPPVDKGNPQVRNIYMKLIICKGVNQTILSQGLPEMILKDIYLKKVLSNLEMEYYSTMLII